MIPIIPITGANTSAESKRRNLSYGMISKYNEIIIHNTENTKNIVFDATLGDSNDLVLI
jgi:hypothetical protein